MLKRIAILSSPKLTWLKLAIATLWTLIISLGLFGVGGAPAYAHRPHDVVSAVQVSPAYSQDSTVYIIVRNNLFRSSDGGNTWKRLVHGLDNRQVPSSLVAAPSDRQVLYMAAVESGVYRSLDGGDTWQSANGDLTDLAVNWLQVSPDDASLVFAQVGEKTLYKTANGGAAWVPVLTDSPAVALAWSPDRSTLLIGTDQGQLYRSDDQGDTWKFEIALPATDTIRRIVFSPNFTQDQTFWVGTGQHGVYQTTDAGQTFVRQNVGLTDLRIEDMAVLADGSRFIATWEGGYWRWDANQQQWINTDEGLTRDPMADDEAVPHFEDLGFSNTFDTDGTVFLGGFDGLYKSTNHGKTWTPLETLSSGAVIDLAISPQFGQDKTLAIATYVGELYLSQDRGETWRAINQDLHLPRFSGNFKPIVTENGDQDPRRFFDMEFSPDYAHDQTLFTSILYSKILRSANGGDNWSLVTLDQNVRGVSLAVSPNFKQDKNVFSTSQKGLIYRSQDGGQSFKQIAKGPAQTGNNSPSLVVSPSFTQDSTLFSSGEQGVYRSEDGGNTWTLLTEGTALQQTGEIQLAIAPDFEASQTLFAASKQGLYRSQNRGGAWEAVDSENFGVHPWIEAIALSPNYKHDHTVVVTVRGLGQFKSQDGGDTFAPMGNPQLAIARIRYVPSAGQALQFSPNYAEDNTLFGFGAADTEIYRSTDGGETWEVLPTPRLQISQIPPLGRWGAAGLWLKFNQRRLLACGILAGLAAAAYALFRRLPFDQMRSRQVRLLIVATGVAAALGWVAFERLVAPELSAENGFFICLGFAVLTWGLTSPWFFRRFVGEATAETLGAIRIITCATLVIMTLWMEDLPSSALLPVGIRQSMGIMDYFYAIPGFAAFTRSQISLQLFEWLTALLLILGTIGFKSRWTVPLGAFCYLILGGVLRQYTWFYHTGLIPVYLLAVLSFTPCSDGLSLDRWLKQRRGQPVPIADQPAAIYGWSRYACWVILAVSYMQAGLSKLYYSGLYWWDPENLKAKLLSTTLEPLQTNWEVSLHLVNAPSLIFALLGLVGLYGELAYGLVLFSRWARLIMPALMASVHIGIWFLQNIVFLDLMLLQLLFYDYTAIRHWLDKRGWGPGGGSTPPTHPVSHPQRLFFYPIMVSVLIVSMSFIWVKHREYYPFTSLQMFSGSNNSGVIKYNKLIAHYVSGEKHHVFPDQFIYPPMNTRYRLTFRECHQESAVNVNKCNQLLQAFGDVHNQIAQAEDKITAFEVQAWVWNYRTNPSDPNYGELDQTHAYQLKQ